ncbi:MAG: hypothetical protein RQ756_03190 [Flavobacteriaceae bacterium]|nr:hypothetical protein [Flavobacteriaceae bacterium]
MNNKWSKLLASLIFDGVGLLSYLIPGFGEMTDVIWAPISAYILTKFYKGNIGKASAFISFVEELAPGFDFIPTFTLTWIYAYLISDYDKTKTIKEA